MLEITTPDGWQLLWTATRLDSRPALARREVWGRYMTSREWNVKRRAALARANGHCERCGHWSLTLQVHHLTYLRRFREWLEDLAVYCDGCHLFISAESDLDPRTMVDQHGFWERGEAA
jgi:5-methylcytosine-specific restriction endonuclease McrA